MTAKVRRDFFAQLIFSAFFSLGIAFGTASAQGQSLMVQAPDISDDHLAFVYAGDIWLADRDGANPRRLTSHPAGEGSPHFSPDGRWIAFNATYENNTDIYVISVDGGQPKRLTWHPGADLINGWNADGSAVVFLSHREVRSGRANQLYTVSTDGGLPAKFMEALANEAVWSPDGQFLAYRPYGRAHRGGSAWRFHRGGVTFIWVLNVETQTVEKIPQGRVNDMNPMWLGDTVYFLSDRDNKAINIFSYNPASKAVTQLTQEPVWDILNANARGDTIVYEAGGRIKSFNTASGETVEIRISVNPDLPQLRPQWKDASRTIQGASLSPTGKRAVITARGEIFTVPVKDGSTRNITGTAGIRESSGIWSPKGNEIAYISDEGGKHALVIVDQTGKGDTRSFELGETGYFTLLDWGGKGQRILYQDNHLNLYAIDVESGDKTDITTNTRRSDFGAVTSSDGEWVAYIKASASFMGVVNLFNFETGTSTAITDGMSDAASPAFSPDGKYLYFTASTNSGTTSVGLDMSSQERPSRSGIYVAVLAADGKSPLLPKAGDEKAASGDEDAAASTDDGEPDSDEGDAKDDDEDEGDAKDDDEDEAASPIDLDGLEGRIVALPVAMRNYDSLAVASDGALFFIERVQPGISIEPPSPNGGGFGGPGAIHALMRFDFKSKEASTAMEKVSGYSMSADGKMLIVSGAGGRLMTAKAAKRVQGKRLSVSDLRVFIDPHIEWSQIFDDVWRMERDYFYAENLHGLDWDGIRARYETLLPHIGRREDLNRLMIEMIAEFQVGHNRIFGGDVHREQPVRVGLLGADIHLENGAHRIAKIYTGESWNPFLKAPLSAPGIGVSEGDYIIAVNGRDIGTTGNVFALLQGTTGKQVTLSVSISPSGDNARDVVVEPIANENALRLWNWVEENRKLVGEATDGQVGYVYLPNTAGAGFTFFNRMFFSQIDKPAMIIDERSNGGGQGANYITDVLNRTYLSSWKDRDGMTYDTPGGAIYGPKVMLIDQDAGSGGDFLPYSFRYMGIGKLIGKRTWGGLIGIAANPPLIDGGFVSVPFFRFYTPEGAWEIENQGVDPDIEVELLPGDVNAGRDTQLDRAIQEVMSQLENFTPVKRRTPPPIPTEPGK